MTQEQDLAAIARSIVDVNRFMALGTADATGTPWVSPVWYVVSRVRLGLATADEALPQPRRTTAGRHCDLRLAPGGRLVRLVHGGRRPGGRGVDVALDAFNRRSEGQGLRAWSRAEVVPRGEFRLYCATAGEQFVLDDHDRRLTVHLQ